MKKSQGSCYAAEKLKYKHTLTGWLFIIMPLATIILSLVLSGNYVHANSYNWWYILIYPGLISMVCCMAGQKDKSAKNRIVLSMPVDLRKVWDSKIAVCAKTVVLSNIIIMFAVWGAGILIEQGMHMELEMKISVPQGITSCFLLIVTCLWQIPACLWMQQRLGFIPAFVVNMILNSWGSISVSLSSLWFLNPYAVPARLMCAVIRLLPNNLIAREGSLTFYPELLDTKAIFIGVPVCLVWFILLWAASREWYRRKGVMSE